MPVPASRLLDNLLIFGRLLRRAGVDVHAGRLAELVEALGYVNLGARDEVYHACRALLVRRQDQIAIFDLAFAAFWREHHGAQPGRHARGTRSAEPRVSVVEILEPDELDGMAGSEGASGIDAAADDAPEAKAPGPETRLKTWSNEGALAGKDFAAFTTDELAEARAALSRLVWQPGARRTRRWVRGRGPRVDLRRAIAGSVRSGGDVV